MIITVHSARLPKPVARMESDVSPMEKEAKSVVQKTPDRFVTGPAAVIKPTPVRLLVLKNSAANRVHLNAVEGVVQSESSV